MRPDTSPVRPVTPQVLAGLVADLALAHERAGTAVRVGIDGPVAEDASALADGVAGELERRAVPVARLHAQDFLRARSLRLEHGADDPDAFLDGWYDLAALRREVLDPLGPGGTGSWLPRLRDAVTDRPFRERRRPAAPGTVAVVDGRFLARQDVRDALDVLVHLDVGAPARARRVPAQERARVLPAWERYLRDCDPAGAAALTVRFDHPDRPAVVLRPT